MCQSTVIYVDNRKLFNGAVKTANYLLDAVREGDFETALLELSELNFVVNRLAELEKQRKKQEVLAQLVNDLREQGINIDYASRPPFLGLVAKNAVENNRNYSNKHKKRQQAIAYCEKSHL